MVETAADKTAPIAVVMDEGLLRRQLVKMLEGGQAHRRFDEVIAGIPECSYGEQPAELPYSPWQLLEHMRIAQCDILDFCRNADYSAPAWPEAYWPEAAAPDSVDDWENSVERFRTDLEEMTALVQDPALDLSTEIPHGDGQTYLREALLVADHNSYHLGQLVTVRRLLGTWPPAERFG